MTDIERAQKIIDQKGGCAGLHCSACPIEVECDALCETNPNATEIHWTEPNPVYAELAESYLLEKKYLDEH